MHYDTDLTGFAVPIQIAAPITSHDLSNLYVANYFNPSDFGDSQSTFPPTPQPTPSPQFYPVADPDPDLSGDPSYMSPYYEFSCTDTAADTIARIRVLIRPWDRVSDFLAYTNPYDPGTESTFGGPWHDYNVWYDLSTSNPANTSGSTYIQSGL